MASISEDRNIQHKNVFKISCSQRSKLTLIYWVIKQCSLVGAYQHFRGICRLHIQNVSELSGMSMSCLKNEWENWTVGSHRIG